MDDLKLSRALTWVGAGGTALAVSTLTAAGLFAVTPDGSSPVARLAPCFSAGCSSMRSAAFDSAWGFRAPASHAGRVTHPGIRGVNQQAAPLSPFPATGPARSAVDAPAKPKPKVVVWATSLPEQHLAAPVVAMASVKNGSILMAGSDGGVFPVGQAGFYGSLSGKPLSQAISAVAADPATGGYWLAGRDGGVFAFNASYHGSMGHTRLSSPVVAMAATPTGNGYWLASADGGVFAFGDAPYLRSISDHHLASPVVAMAATPDGKGYWLASRDGGVFAFGDAPFKGSLSRVRLQSPIVAMAATPDGKGYWLASQDGGVFAFGDAVYRGGFGGPTRSVAVSAIVPTATGQGYWLAGVNGQVSAFGDARPVQVTPPAPKIVATADNHPGPGHAQPAVRAESLPERRVAPPAPVRGRGDYKPGSVGYDISQYQCGDIPPALRGVAVVQVTDGAIDTPPNPCYVQEARWAGDHLSAYIYLDGLPSPAPVESLTGPAGNCVVTNIACASYNYGYNWSRYWVAYSRGAGVFPDTWWLDVERYSGWQATVSNQLLIRGALDGLKSMGVASGVYSTASQWQEITGGMAIPGEPEWTPGAGNLAGPGYSATSFCAAPGAYTFGGGRLKMVQYGYSGPFPGSYSGSTAYDLDFAC